MKKRCGTILVLVLVVVLILALAISLVGCAPTTGEKRSDINISGPKIGGPKDVGGGVIPENLPDWKTDKGGPG